MEMNLNGEEIMNNYIMMENLGKGAFGEVRLAKSSKTGQLFVDSVSNKAIKIQEVSHLAYKFGGAKREIVENMIMREAAIMRKMNHPNILKTTQVIENLEEDTFCIVTEYMSRGYLGGRDFLAFANCKRGQIPVEILRKSLRECISGLFYCINSLFSALCGQSRSFGHKTREYLGFGRSRL